MILQEKIFQTALCYGCCEIFVLLRVSVPFQNENIMVSQGDIN